VIVRLLAEQRWEVIPGAESSASLAARVRTAADHVVATVGPGAAAVAISHGGVIAELCREATGSDPFAFLHVDNASITRIVVGADGRWMLRSFNDTTHLAGAAAGPPSRPRR
jgi:probable phosphoglycerate mutase